MNSLSWSGGLLRMPLLNLLLRDQAIRQPQPFDHQYPVTSVVKNHGEVVPVQRIDRVNVIIQRNLGERIVLSLILQNRLGQMYLLFSDLLQSLLLPDFIEQIFDVRVEPIPSTVYQKPTSSEVDL